MHFTQIVFFSLLVFVLASASFAEDIDPKNISIGSTTTCKHFLESRAYKNDAYKAYVNGFISGYGLENSGTGLDGSATLGEISISQAIPMLEKLCKEDLSKNFIKTLLRVCKDLSLY